MTTDGLSIIQGIITRNPDLNCRIPADAVRAASRFREDLGMDSLSMMSLLFELQESYPHLAEKDLLGWKTVGDTLEALRCK